MKPSFNLLCTDSQSSARAGELHTAHGVVETPIFMPVGTAGTVKTVHQHELTNTVQAQIILGNTYHLYLRPGLETLQQAGGLHRFIGWNKPMLTDSGGYQVYSLSQRRKIKEEGVQFMSHIDGSRHFFTPEYAVDIQRIIGADIIMAFDECTPFPCDYKYAAKSLALTHRWLDRCLNHFDQTEPLYGHGQLLAPIVQGSVYKDLRMESAHYIAEKNQSVNAIGGLSVGEPAPLLYEMTGLCCDILPTQHARYLMGVGTPENLLECIALGVDMFDCVLPTRNARHGLIYTSQGILHIKNEKWKRDFSLIDPGLEETETPYTKAYLRHLIHSGEFLGMQIASLQNLRFYLWLVKEARTQIQNGTFTAWKNQLLPVITRKL
jgi:queuine tRNA-ribosyltransferase